MDTVQLTEKTDKGRALARPRKGSFSGANAEKQADDPLRGLGELGVDHLEQGLGIPTIGAELVQGEGQPAGGGLGVLADGKGGAERGASGGVLSHRRPADGDRLADGAAAQCQPRLNAPPPRASRRPAASPPAAAIPTASPPRVSSPTPRPPMDSRPAEKPPMARKPVATLPMAMIPLARQSPRSRRLICTSGRPRRVRRLRNS